jgi:hypothetical protein
MSVSVTRRIHIAPQGYEDERIYLPALDLDADQVILVHHQDEDDTASRCRDTIKEKLNEEGVDTEVKQCNIFDLTNSFETLLGIIHSRPSNDDIKVNVSAGSKITAIAGMMACMFTEAEPIYVIPEEYGEATVSNGMEDINALPAYPIAEPDYQLIQVLDYIHEKQEDDGPRGVLLKEIGEFLLENDLRAVKSSDKEPGEGEKIYDIVRGKIITPLTFHGLIGEKRFDGGVHVQTTDKGEEMLDLGRSLLNDGEWAKEE